MLIKRECIKNCDYARWVLIQIITKQHQQELESLKEVTNGYGARMLLLSANKAQFGFKIHLPIITSSAREIRSRGFEDQVFALWIFTDLIIFLLQTYLN